MKFGDHPQVRQYMRGVYNDGPPRHRYVTMWDPSEVIKNFQEEPWVPLKDLSLKMLATKVITLILLISSQRGQIIMSLDLDNMVDKGDTILFKIPSESLKQGRPGYKPKLLTITSFQDKNICPVQHLQEYLSRTAELRGNIRQVFLTTRKPYKPVSRDTVSRWVKDALASAGVDMTEFAAGSTRAAASSKARQAGVPLDEILEAGGGHEPQPLLGGTERK